MLPEKETESKHETTDWVVALPPINTVMVM